MFGVLNVFCPFDPNALLRLRALHRMLHLGSVFPDIQAAASGLPGDKISLYSFLGDGWGLFMR